MKRLDHLLFIVSEEGAEVGHRASKAARFGLDESQPGQGEDNATRLIGEFADLIGVMEMLHEEGHIVLPSLESLRPQIDAKKVKVEKFLEYSMKCGTLDYPCRSLPQERWCDHSGPGGFMGHTCVRRKAP